MVEGGAECAVFRRRQTLWRVPTTLTTGTRGGDGRTDASAVLIPLELSDLPPPPRRRAGAAAGLRSHGRFRSHPLSSSLLTKYSARLQIPAVFPAFQVAIWVPCGERRSLAWHSHACWFFVEREHVGRSFVSPVAAAVRYPFSAMSSHCVLPACTSSVFQEVCSGTCCPLPPNELLGSKCLPSRLRGAPCRAAPCDAAPCRTASRPHCCGSLVRPG